MLTGPVKPAFVTTILDIVLKHSINIAKTSGVGVWWGPDSGN